jgi:hypothetical protein
MPVHYRPCCYWVGILASRIRLEEETKMISGGGTWNHEPGCEQSKLKR